MNYILPETTGNIEWFYNEIKIPKGNNVVGSYFMANGFIVGYLGIQVNSRIEHRIFFSVRSPFKTDHPEQIPEDEKVTLLKKGDNVMAGNFGDDFSGGIPDTDFFLTNCGFFNENCNINTLFVPKQSDKKPNIDFSGLP